MTLSTGGSNHPTPILRLISWQNRLLTAQNLFPDEYFDLYPSIDTKNSLFISILLPLRAVKWRRSKIKFFKPKKVKISNFELLKCFIPQKKAEKMYNADLARKNKISCKKNFFFRFFNFSPKARGPLKIFDVQFSETFKKKFQKWLLWDLSGIERNKVKSFGEPNPSPSETADGFKVVRDDLTPQLK